MKAVKAYNASTNVLVDRESIFALAKQIDEPPHVVSFALHLNNCSLTPKGWQIKPISDTSPFLSAEQLAKGITKMTKTKTITHVEAPAPTAKNNRGGYKRVAVKAYNAATDKEVSAASISELCKLIGERESAVYRVFSNAERDRHIKDTAKGWQVKLLNDDTPWLTLKQVPPRKSKGNPNMRGRKSKPLIAYNATSKQTLPFNSVDDLSIHFQVNRDTVYKILSDKRFWLPKSTWQVKYADDATPWESIISVTHKVEPEAPIKPTLGDLAVKNKNKDAINAYNIKTGEVRQYPSQAEAVKGLGVEKQTLFKTLMNSSQRLGNSNWLVKHINDERAWIELRSTDSSKAHVALSSKLLAYNYKLSITRTYENIRKAAKGLNMQRGDISKTLETKRMWITNTDWQIKPYYDETPWQHTQPTAETVKPVETAPMQDMKQALGKVEEVRKQMYDDAKAEAAKKVSGDWQDTVFALKNVVGKMNEAQKNLALQLIKSVEDSMTVTLSSLIIESFTVFNSKYKKSCSTRYAK